MKFPESWLRDFVDTPLTGEALAHALTMAGLESEELAPAAAAFASVVVARVLQVTKHPDADRLNVCRVDIGDATPRQIVCGAPNVVAGMTVPCALPGAQLPGGIEIKVAKVRGVESTGMLCSARELGLSEDASGLLPLDGKLVPGTDIRLALELDDWLHVLKMTPNRGDCLSLLGIAREVAAITGAVLKAPRITPVAITATAEREIVLDSPLACPRYCGRVIEGVNATAPSPDWMRRRLERSGIRSISALVDITNYVMLELGQPLHAFDNAKLAGAIHARMAKPGENLLLLNEQTIAVDADVLMIADDEKPLAMAGVMGGEGSGIALETTAVFLESAFFEPAAIAGRARRYGFVSDASHRFERGVDFEGARCALERASQLVLGICGGAAGPITEASAELPPRPPVMLRRARLAKVLGVTLSEAVVGGFFTRLGFDWRQDGENFVAIPPSCRFDISIEEDLIEEVARLHGYENIPVRPPCAQLSMLPQTEAERPVARVRQKLVERGYQEVVNYAFVDAAWEADFSGNAAPIKLANPIASQMGVMRTTLIGGLVANLITNQRRKQAQVRIFETGRCFLRDPTGAPVEGFHQPWRLAGLAWGSDAPEQWAEATRRVDFFDVKGDVEALFGTRELRFEKREHPSLHPGRAARVIADGRDVGIIGELHPRWVQKYDLVSPPVLFEVERDALLAAVVPVYEEQSNQPVVVRDLAIVVDREISLQEILDVFRAQAPVIVRDVRLFDLYLGKGVEDGKKSLAFRIVMQDTQKTLQDVEVDEAMQKLLTVVGSALGARLRA